MNNLIRTVSIVPFVLALTGCAALHFQSDAITQEAVQLDSDVQSFKAQKQAEVDKLNKTFQDTSEKLFDQLTMLGDEELDLERDLNSQGLADEAIIHPNKVLMPTAMHDSSLSFINDQFARIEAVDQQITDARNQYASSAKALQASITQLTNIDTALKKLISSPSDPDAEQIWQFIESGYDGAKAGVAAAKTASTSAPKAPAVPAPK